MKYCTRCNAQVADGNFCQRCGSALAEFTQPTQSPVYNNQSNNNAGYTAPTPIPTAVPYKMKWFKFLIYFALFAGAIMNLATGIQCITGNIYELLNQDGAELVYSVFPNMKAVNICYGIALLALAAFQIFVRFSLACYKKYAPGCIYVLYIVSAVLGIVYVLACYFVVESVAGNAIANDAFDNSSFIGQAVMNAAMVCINYTYFNKRKSLFVN